LTFAVEVSSLHEPVPEGNPLSHLGGGNLAKILELYAADAHLVILGRDVLR
jgi:hypothetical protein